MGVNLFQYKTRWWEEAVLVLVIVLVIVIVIVNVIFFFMEKNVECLAVTKKRCIFVLGKHLLFLMVTDMKKIKLFLAALLAIVGL